MDDLVFRRYSVAIVTPFEDARDEDAAVGGIEHPQRIDFEAFGRCIDHVAEGLQRLGGEFGGQIGGIIVSGSTGEQHSMSIAERQEVQVTSSLL